MQLTYPLAGSVTCDKEARGWVRGKSKNKLANKEVHALSDQSLIPGGTLRVSQWHTSLISPVQAGDLLIKPHLLLVEDCAQGCSPSRTSRLVLNKWRLSSDQRKTPPSFCEKSIHMDKQSLFKVPMTSGVSQWEKTRALTSINHQATSRKLHSLLSGSSHDGVHMLQGRVVRIRNIR